MIDTFNSHRRSEYILPRIFDFAQNASYLSRCFPKRREAWPGGTSNTSSRTAANPPSPREGRNRNAQIARPRD
jgi:hypothetical protein